MRKKLMLEALAAWLALAVTSGQACASIQSGANSVPGVNGVSTMVASPKASLDEITTLYSDGKVPANGGIRANSDVALLTSAAVARKGTRTRMTTGVHAPASSPFRIDAPQLKRRAIFDQRDMVGASQPQGVLVTANGGTDQIKAVRTARDGELDAEKFYLIANTKQLAPEPRVPVPEPGNWATVLAGLLGVIAIARRRMSL